MIRCGYLQAGSSVTVSNTYQPFPSHGSENLISFLRGVLEAPYAPVLSGQQ
jgi:hypothetical protein